jgi:putative Mg2+ transporter-C (MgtC) family protein
MLTTEQMLTRFAVALILGAILGIERELVGKETGVRTEMLVAAGAAIFTMVGMILPYLATTPLGVQPGSVAVTNGFSVIANIIVGIGFLGAGLIVKDGPHTHNLTTAALVWTTAAIGILAGLGLWQFAGIVTIILTVLLYIIRKMSIKKDFERYTDAPIS